MRLRLPTHSASHRCARGHAQPPSRSEAALLAAVLFALAVALLGPPWALPAHYHAFADQRAAWGVPHIADVLSNLPFAFLGVLGLRALVRLPAEAEVGSAQRGLLALLCAGLLLICVGSSLYHWQPDDVGLAWDRSGMSIAFAGLLGLAVADRLSARAGWTLALSLLLLAPLAALLPLFTGNMLPWVVLQAGGLLLLAALAACPRQPGALHWNPATVLALYIAAKGLELADHSIFVLTHASVAGHTLKHLVAAGAVWPVVSALRQRRFA